MNKKITVVALLITLAGLLSCQKKEVIPQEEETVNINIISPQQGQNYKKGDTIFIGAEITYNGQMHGYIARILNNKDSVLYEAEGHTHGDNIAINEQWVNIMEEEANLQVEIVAVISHDSEEKSSKVSFNSQP